MWRRVFFFIEPMTNRKLQKLCYYAYAWYLTLTHHKLADCFFEAWIHGPVCPELFYEYRRYGDNIIEREKEIPKVIINNRQVNKLIETVYKMYGNLSIDELELMTHNESPWLIAREGLNNNEPCHRAISDLSIINYYRQFLN